MMRKHGYEVLSYGDLWACIDRVPQPYLVIDAAWAGVRSADRVDAHMQSENVSRVRRQLVALRGNPPRGYVGLGSQAEFGRTTGLVDELAPLEPTDPYGRAKVEVSELLGEEFDSTATAFAWLRVFAAYGFGQPTGWLIPDAMRALSANEPFVVRQPGARQDFVWADDVAAACLACAFLSVRGTFNVGSGNVYSIYEVVGMVREVLNSGSEVLYAPEGYTATRALTGANIDKIRSATGWLPRTPMAVGIERLAQSFLTGSMT